MHQILLYSVSQKSIQMEVKTQISTNSNGSRWFQHLSPIDRISGQNKQKQETSELKIFYQMDLRDNCRIFQPNTKEYTFYLEVHESFSKTDSMLGPKTNLKIQIIPCIFSGHYAIEFKIDSEQNSS